MSEFEVGDRVRHFKFGIGTIIALGVAERQHPTVSVRFDHDSAERVLVIQYAKLRRVTEIDEARSRRERDVNLAETFVAEPADTSHFLVSHWHPFFEQSAKDVLERLPEYVESALVQSGYGGKDIAPPFNSHIWADGIVLAWPNLRSGIHLVERITDKNLELVSMFPFSSDGTEHTITLERVVVWESGLEAQIECTIGDACVTFFDTEFVLNRGWYRKGQSCHFVLCGIAYSAKPGESREWVIPAETKGAKTFRKFEAKRTGDPVSIEPLHISTRGMAALLQIDEWDVDDYSFHGPVTAVTETEMLGQPAWRVRTVVLRVDEDIEIEILITKRVWSGVEVPRIGEDIEGRLWLQGHLSGGVYPQK